MSTRQSPSSPLQDATDHRSPAALEDLLDAAALAALRSLDPNGAKKLLDRVLATFESSTTRLANQLQRARDSADIESLKLVAHTLKSSSASIGAVKLSGLCAEIETMIRCGQPYSALDSRVVALDAEIAYVLGALRSLLHCGP